MGQKKEFPSLMSKGKTKGKAKGRQFPSLTSKKGGTSGGKSAYPSVKGKQSRGRSFPKVIST